MTTVEIVDLDDRLDGHRNALARAKQRGGDPDLIRRFADLLSIAETLIDALGESVDQIAGYQQSQERLAAHLRLLEADRAQEVEVLRERPREVTFFVDGACAGQHSKKKVRRMGVGVVRLADGHTHEWSLPFGPGSNDIAELIAVREALLRVERRKGSNVVIYLDSAYCIGVLKGGWRAKVNQELIAEIQRLMRECRSCHLEKVKGHSGNLLNDRADALASAATELPPKLEEPNG